ncbi:MAG: hypothetical protein AAGA60_19805 [Cyanobacteria bacterium P01_E01_bin.42]
MNQDINNKDTINRNITPQVSRDRIEHLLGQILGTRMRDLETLENNHRDLLTASSEDYQRFLAFFADTEPTSTHLSVGLALLATGADPKGRQFARQLLQKLPLKTLADTVDYIQGWYRDRTHTLQERRRFSDSMAEAYSETAPLVREALQREGMTQESGDFTGGEIVVTLGIYDKVQQVLDALGLTYRIVPCQIVVTLPLRADQVLIVNCPGSFDAEGIEVIHRFVINGGTLITTDWALQTTLQLAFPDTCQWNNITTRDDVVPVSWVDPDSIYTQGVEVPEQVISWWLEDTSYPIQIISDRVQILMRSQEMGKRYGDDPLVVAFNYGEGMVFHFTSHYYLQRSQGNKNSKASEVISSLGIDLSDRHALDRISGEQFAAAYSSLRLLANILYERRRAYGV